MADGDGEVTPRDEHEFSVALELSTGQLLEQHGLPGAKLATSYTRKWDGRGPRFFRRMMKYAGVDEEALADRVESDDTFADALAAAGQKATLNGADVMHDWLARLVAAAFHDDAKVDTVAFLISIVAQLEPVHLRELRDVVRPPMPRWPVRVEVGPGVLERSIAEGEMRAAVMLRLSSLGLVEDADVGKSFKHQPTRWRGTGLGKELVRICEEAVGDPPTG